MDKPKAVIFGAGSVGRGFLGQLFSESGYALVFVDIDEALIRALQVRREYTLRMVDNDSETDLVVSPATGLLSSDENDVASVVAEATLGATAVGPRALAHVAPLIARAIALRAERGTEAPLNLIVCENLKGAGDVLRRMVGDHLERAAHDYMASHVGFVDTVIGRMAPEVPSHLRVQNPALVIVEPYRELPVDRAGFVGQIPEVVGMVPRDDFAVYTARKLYLHNAGHAILGYLGYRRGCTFGYEALEDSEVRPILDGAMDESIRGIVAQYGAEEQCLGQHVDDLMRRFANRALADPVARLARDPIRKLAPEDRLVGAARTAQAARSADGTPLLPANLSWGIAGALAYDAPVDPIAVELRMRVAHEGASRVLGSLCDIAPDEPLGRAVLACFSRLHEEPRWQCSIR